MRHLLLAALALCFLLPAAGLRADARPLIRDAALVTALQKQRLTSVHFEDVDLDGIVKWLRVATGKNILVKQGPLAKAGVQWRDLRWTVDLEDVSVWTFLGDVVCQPHGMAVKVSGNIIFLTSQADSYGKVFTQLYSISHITWTKTDFIGPEINLQPSGFVGDEYEPEKVVEDDPLASGDAVAELIKEIVLPKGWESNDDWTIKATDRYLVIRAPRDVHARIPRALDVIASMK